MKNFLNKYKEAIIILIILIFGSYLRLHNLWSMTSFNADQEWLAYRAKDVLSGDLVLLGPVTSVGSFSIGPGFIYLWSLFDLFTGNAPISGAYLSVFLGILSIVCTYVFIRKFIDKKVALLILLIMSVSSYLVFLDQNPWAPSLYYLAEMLILYGSYLSTKDKNGYLWLALGFVAGFQSHIGVILSFISVLIYFVVVRPVKPDIKTLSLSFSIILLGILPNVVFDVTHNYVNLMRLFDTLRGDGVDYFVGFGKIINVLAYNAVSHIYPRHINLYDSVVIKVIFALIIVNGIRLLRDKIFNKLSALLLISTIFPGLYFYIQQGKFSEYYLMMTVPPLIILLGLFLKELINRKALITLILMVSIFLNVNEIKSRSVKVSLKAKEDVARYMIQKGGKENYGISLTTKHGEQFGLKYVFDYYGIKADIPPKIGETKIFSVIIPEGFDGVTGLIDIDGIGLIWQGM